MTNWEGGAGTSNTSGRIFDRTKKFRIPEYSNIRIITIRITHTALKPFKTVLQACLATSKNFFFYKKMEFRKSAFSDQGLGNPLKTNVKSQLLILPWFL